VKLHILIVRPPESEEDKESQSQTLAPPQGRKPLFPGFHQLGRLKGEKKRETLRHSRR